MNANTNPAKFEQLKKLASFYTEIEAQSIVNVLADHGIDAQAVGGFTAGFKAEGPGRVDVLVLSDSLSDARELLRQIDAVSDDEIFDEVLPEDEGDDQTNPRSWTLLWYVMFGACGAAMYWLGGGREVNGVILSFCVAAGIVWLAVWSARREAAS